MSRKRRKKQAEKLLKELTIDLCKSLGLEYDEEEIDKMVAECASSAKEEINLEEYED